ncbi:MAG: MFS transporter [Chloroflexi bacterium]|nr:MFS transporter [Chloroflexota bacterium]
MPKFYLLSARTKVSTGKVNKSVVEIKLDSRPKPAGAKEFESAILNSEQKDSPSAAKAQPPIIGKSLPVRIPTNQRFGFFDYIWISLFWLGITYLWGGINGVILPHLNQQLVGEAYKGTTLGIIMSLGMIVAMVVQPAAGALSDIKHHRWGRRRPFILLGGAMAVVALLLLSGVALFFRNWWLLLLAYLFLQFADNIAQGAYQGFIPDMVPDGKRGRASGAMGVAQIFGNVGGLTIATYFIDQEQPSLAIMAICIVFSLTLVPTLFLVQEEPFHEGDTGGRLHTLVGIFGELRHYPAFIHFIISRLFVMTAIATISIFALYFLQDVIHQPQGTLSQSYTVLGIVVVACSLLSIFPAVWLSERIGRKRLVILSCSVGAVGMLLLATATNMTHVVFYSILLGVATGSFNSIDWALATDLIPREAAGRFMGISNLAGAGSQALAALVGGLLRDGFNALGETFFQIKNLGYSALFIFGAVYFLLGIFFLLKVQEQNHVSSQ